MDQALFAIREGIFTLSQAAREYSIPATTLRDSVMRLGIKQGKAPRLYVRRADNQNLTKAIKLVLEDGLSVGAAVRETKVARATLRGELAKIKANKMVLTPISPQLQSTALSYEVPPPFSAPSTTAALDKPVPVRVTLPIRVVPQALVKPMQQPSFVYSRPQPYSAPAVSMSTSLSSSSSEDVNPAPTSPKKAVPMSTSSSSSSSENVNPAPTSPKKAVPMSTSSSSDDVTPAPTSPKKASPAVDLVPSPSPSSHVAVAQKDKILRGNRKVKIMDRIIEVQKRPNRIHPYNPANESSSVTFADGTDNFSDALEFQPLFVDGCQSLSVNSLAADKVRDIFTPSPPPASGAVDPYEFVEDPPTDDLLRPTHPSLDKSPVAGPSHARSPSPPRDNDDEWRDVSEEEELDRPRRRTCAEALTESIETLMVKYCPICPFYTCSNKLGRHMANKHSKEFKKPVKIHIKKVCDIITAESRKSFSVVPMAAIKRTLGAYWDDRSYRSIAQKLTIMGRMKVYGGSWDLDDVKDMPHPFVDHINNVEHVTPPKENYFGCLPRIHQTPQPEKRILTPRPEIQIPTPQLESVKGVAPVEGVQAAVTATKNFETTAKKLPTVRKAAQELGLNRQLPRNHPLIVMFARSLKISHGEGSSAAENYVANVSRVLMYVHQHLVDTKFPPRHWSDLVSTDVQPYMDYMEKRENLGQTKATSINYLKNLRLLFGNIVNIFVHEDPTFPKGFDLSPCTETITKIKLLDQKLDLVYRRKTKQQPAELFKRKTEEAKNLPEYGEVARSLNVIREGISDNLSELEKTFAATVGHINVRSEKNGSPAEKKISGLWRRTTAGLAIQILWTTKQRSGVAVNMLLQEWEARQHHDCSTVVTVADHKTGDKEPATLVLNEEMEGWMDRYYNLRRRTGYDRPNFFVTNRGDKINKIYDDVTKIFGRKLTASIFRRMVESSGRDHDAATSGAIAQALQHSDKTASQYYRLPDAAEALRRNHQIELVDHTALVKCYIDKHFEDLFPLNPYEKFQPDEWMSRIKNSSVIKEYPSAVIDIHYVMQLGDRFDGAMYHPRALILKNEMVKANYTIHNYTEYAVVDVAKKKKISHFLKNLKFRKKIIAKVRSLM